MPLVEFRAGASQSTSITVATSHRHQRVAVGLDFELMMANAAARAARRVAIPPEGGNTPEGGIAYDDESR